MSWSNLVCTVDKLNSLLVYYKMRKPVWINMSGYFKRHSIWKTLYDVLESTVSSFVSFLPSGKYLTRKREREKGGRKDKEESFWNLTRISLRKCTLIKETALRTNKPEKINLSFGLRDKWEIKGKIIPN